METSWITAAILSPGCYCDMAWVANVLEVFPADSLCPGGLMHGDVSQRSRVFCVSDCNVSVKAIITEPALNKFYKGEEELHMEHIKGKAILIQEFYTDLDLHQELNKCEFYLVVNRFRYLPGCFQHLEVQHCSSYPPVWEKQKELWREMQKKSEANSGINLTQLLNIMDKTGEETWVGRAFACLNAVSDDGGGSYESWTPWDRARDLAKGEKFSGSEELFESSSIKMCFPEESSDGFGSADLTVSDAGEGQCVGPVVSKPLDEQESFDLVDTTGVSRLSPEGRNSLSPLNLCPDTRSNKTAGSPSGGSSSCFGLSLQGKRGFAVAMQKDDEHQDKSEKIVLESDEKGDCQKPSDTVQVVHLSPNIADGCPEDDVSLQFCFLPTPQVIQPSSGSSHGPLPRQSSTEPSPPRSHHRAVGEPSPCQSSDVPLLGIAPLEQLSPHRSFHSSMLSQKPSNQQPRLQSPHPLLSLQASCGLSCSGSNDGTTLSVSSAPPRVERRLEPRPLEWRVEMMKKHHDGSLFCYTYAPPTMELCETVCSMRLPGSLRLWAQNAFRQEEM
uniref:Shelterin complex subunit TPP1/Est3 domain-containing protein n=1 Tax=Eptatretus burgeri TaxID=7764 RepID=A0A8C4Q7H4_EPTBU